MDAYREHKNRVLKPFFTKYPRRQRVLAKVKTVAKLMGSLACMASAIVVWFACVIAISPFWGTAAFCVLMYGFFFQLLGDQSERDAKIRARLMEVAKTGERQQMIEAIRKEFK